MRKADPGDRMPEAAAVDFLVELGSALAARQASDPAARDGVGLNNADLSAWPQVAATRDYDLLRSLLRKYHAQIDGASWWRAGLGDPIARHGNVVAVRYEPPRVVFPAAKIANFDAYLSVQKRFKAHGAYFDGRTRYWALDAAHVCSFPFSDYVRALESIGVAVVGTAWPPRGFTPPVHGAPQSPGASEIRIRRVFGVSGVPDGAFMIQASFSRELNAFLSNKRGELSGIFEYRRDLDHARVTPSLELVEELLEKLPQRLPHFRVRLEGVEDARAERAERHKRLARPLPEVARHLGIDRDTQAPYELFPYQNEGVRFMQATGGRCLLGDEMGLGKTLQALSFAATLDWSTKTLAIGPRAVRQQWVDEANRFFPRRFNAVAVSSRELRQAKRRFAYHAERFHAEYPDRPTTETNVLRFALGLEHANLISTNYEALEKLEPLLPPLTTVLIDESQRLKNPKAKLTKTVQRVAQRVEHRILMSGTAIKNRRDELFTQLELVRPGLYPSAKALKRDTIGSVFNRLQAVYLGRRKADVAKSMPPKVRTAIRQTMHGLPRMPPRFSIEEISRYKAEFALAKVPFTLDFVQGLLDGSESRVLVFSDSERAANAVARELGDCAVLYTGRVSDALRQTAVARFRDPAGGVRAFVATTQAAGVGLNLEVADKVVFNDLPWTAADQEQAEDRAHRATSRNAVNVYAMVADHPWDEAIHDLIHRKRVLKEKQLAGRKLTKAERDWAKHPLSLREILEHANPFCEKAKGHHESAHYEKLRGVAPHEGARYSPWVRSP